MNATEKLERIMQELGDEAALVAIAKAIGEEKLNTVCDAIAKDYEINLDEEEEIPLDKWEWAELVADSMTDEEVYNLFSCTKEQLTSNYWNYSLEIAYNEYCSTFD